MTNTRGTARDGGSGLPLFHDLRAIANRRSDLAVFEQAATTAVGLSNAIVYLSLEKLNPEAGLKLARDCEAVIHALAVALDACTTRPQFFQVAGMVETDLKERYESLVESFDAVQADRRNAAAEFEEVASERNEALLALDRLRKDANGAKLEYHPATNRVSCDIGAMRLWLQLPADDRLAKVTAERDALAEAADKLAEALNPKLDVSKPPSLGQDVAITINVLDRFGHGDGVFVKADGVRALGIVRRMWTALGHCNTECGKLASRVAVLEGELSGMTLNRDNLRTYLDERTKERDAARADANGADTRARRSRRIMEAVIDAVHRPAPDGSLLMTTPEMHGRCLRLVDELATMTDLECEMLDGIELRSIALLHRVPDAKGERVPTVPRVYTEEDRKRARDAILRLPPWNVGPDSASLWVDAVADALGMRRAGA